MMIAEIPEPVVAAIVLTAIALVLVAAFFSWRKK